MPQGFFFSVCCTMMCCSKQIGNPYLIREHTAQVSVGLLLLLCGIDSGNWLCHYVICGWMSLWTLLELKGYLCLFSLNFTLLLLLTNLQANIHDGARNTHQTVLQVGNKPPFGQIICWWNCSKHTLHVYDVSSHMVALSLGLIQYRRKIPLNCDGCDPVWRLDNFYNRQLKDKSYISRLIQYLHGALSLKEWWVTVIIRQSWFLLQVPGGRQEWNLPSSSVPKSIIKLSWNKCCSI